MQGFRILTGSLLVIVLLASACSDSDEQDDDAGLPNPASVHCEERGGTLEIRTDAAGNETGFCVFDSGSECEEWAFYRGECTPEGPADPTGLANPASVYCEEQGGVLEMRSSEQGEYGVCIFSDGSECEEWAYFRGECAPGG